MTSQELIGLYAENLRRMRQQRGLSQEKVAELAEISTGYLSEIENQKRSGTFDTMAALATALEVEPYELILPQAAAASYNSQKTRNLMKRLRSNVADLMNVLEQYLSE